MIGMLAILIGSQGIPAEQMRDVVAARRRALDHLVVNVAERRYTAPLAAAPLDRAAWQALPSQQGELADGLQFELTIAHPGAMLRFLTDAPARGYVPVTYSFVDGRSVSRHERALRPDGRLLYRVLDGDLTPDALVSSPILQVFDVHLVATPRPQTTVLDLFDDHGATLCGGSNGVSTYCATIDSPEGRSTWRIDLADNGTPRYVRAEYSHPQAQGQNFVIVKEQYTLATMRVNGAELPGEAVVTAHSRGPGADATRSIWHFKVQKVEMRAGLGRADVTIEPPRRNAIITKIGRHGRVETREYDAQGKRVAIHTTGGLD